jgi:hypothetical protein
MIIFSKENNRALTVEEQKTVIGTVITETEVKHYQHEDMDAYLEFTKSIQDTNQDQQQNE